MKVSAMVLFWKSKEKVNMKFFLILFSGLLFNDAVVRSQSKDEFVLVRKDGDISIYERWIIFPKSDPPVDAREVKSEFTFNSNIYEALRIIQDEEKIKKWQDHVSEFKVYKQEDTTTWLEYSYHDIPWPVSDQDHLLVYTLKEQAPGDLFISFESTANDTLAPLRKGVTRMQLSGSWRLQQLSPEKIKATYRILSKPLAIPKFLTDPIIRNNMMTTIKEFIILNKNEK